MYSVTNIVLEKLKSWNILDFFFYPNVGFSGDIVGKFVQKIINFIWIKKINKHQMMLINKHQMMLRLYFYKVFPISHFYCNFIPIFLFRVIWQRKYYLRHILQYRDISFKILPIFLETQKKLSLRSVLQALNCVKFHI